MVGAIEDTAGNAQAYRTEAEAVRRHRAHAGSQRRRLGRTAVTNDKLTVLVSADEKSRNPSRNSGITVSVEVVEAAEGDNEGEGGRR